VNITWCVEKEGRKEGRKESHENETEGRKESYARARNSDASQSAEPPGPVVL
jgi:hypothetical protein